jgi:ADP-heptose:LPS heptosyltransferase
MTVPVISALIKSHPNAKISVLTKTQFTPLFKHLPTIEVIGVDLKKQYNGLLGLFQLSKKIKALRVNAVADLHYVLRTKVLRILLPRLNWAILDKGRKEKNQLITGKIFKPLKPIVERYADVFRHLGFDLSLSTPDFPTAQPLPKEIQSLLKECPQPYIGIAPFAAYSSKTYSLDKMKAVIDHFSKTGATVVMFGGGQTEVQKLNEIANLFPNVISVAGRLSLDDELKLIGHLKVMLAMDSGNAHMAALMGVKVLTLWGVTHPYSGFKPYNQPLEYCLVSDLEKFPKIPTSIYGNRYPKGYEKAIESISEKEIIAAIEKIV